MQGNKEFEFKNINLISTFLLLLVVFVVFLFLRITQVGQRENIYTTYQNRLYSLEILDKSFDAFFLNQRKIINYDKIVSQMQSFRDIVQKLEKNDISTYYKSGTDIGIAKIKKLFEEKSILIERYKSYNATSLYALAYIMDLKKALEKEDNESYIKLVDILTTDTMKSYLNFNINQEKLEESIKKLSKLEGKTTTLKYFYISIKSIVDKLKKISKIKKKALTIPLYSTIKNLHNMLEIEHKKIDLKQNRITRYMFIFTFMLLVALFYIYKKSIKLQKDLYSFKYAVENSDDSIVITDKERNITYVNEAFTENTGYSEKEALGRNPNILKSGEMPEEFYKEMNKTLDRSEKWSGNFINKDKNGNIYYEKASITPMFTDKKLTGYMAIKLNTTEHMKEQEKVRFLADHDSLTNLPNRRMMKRVILYELKNSDNRYISLFFLDLDGFKNINDTLGHDVGDKLLIEVSKKLKRYIKDKNRIFRTGGDEFAILECSKEIDRDKTIAEDILELVNEPILAHDNILRVGVSIGIAKFRKTEDNLISLLKHADIAMYEAKKRGKNRYRYYTHDLSIKIDKKTKVEQKLLSALESGHFYTVYQPKYCMKTHKIKSIEALIRWKDNDLGFISPDYFIPIAEEMGLIGKIGEFVFRKACEDFNIFSSINQNLSSVSINVSPAQFMDDRLIEKFEKIMKETNANPKNIGIEVTETHLMKNIKENSKLLYKLKDLGCEIIIDDFGTGYSSLNYLKKLPIDNLKIDKSFVDDICTNESDKKIAKAIVGIAKSFNYTLVAEGIEEKEQESLLLDMGVEIGQGYLFSKPKTKEELLEFLNSSV